MDVSETEVIESAAELVELYNPADIYAAFAEAAREAAGLAAEPTAEGDLLDAAGIGAEEARHDRRTDPYAAAADEWAAAPAGAGRGRRRRAAAQRLYDLALEFQERSQRSEARLLEQFEDASSVLIGKIGDLIVNDDDDERLTLTASGEFRAEVLTEEDERVAAARDAPRSSSSTTTRPTSSATWPTRSPRRSRRSRRSSPHSRPTPRARRSRRGGRARPRAPTMTPPRTTARPTTDAPATDDGTAPTEGDARR